MFSYRAYCLGIRSAIPLPDLLPGNSVPDVFVHGEKNYFVPSKARHRQWYFEVTQDKATIFFRDIGLFLVQRGNEIIFNPAPKAQMRTIQLCIVGMVIAFLLYQRGLLTLHASAIGTERDAVAFIGGTGYGKSSIAAALLARGYGIVADDVLPVELEVESINVFPGFPQLKLNPKVAAALRFDLYSLIPLQHKDGKLGFRRTESFPRRPLPLKHIFTIGKGPELAIEPLRPQEAFIELISNSYPTRIFQPGGTSHFHLCSELAKKIPFHRIRHPYSLSSLPDLARIVEEHFLDESIVANEANPTLIRSQSARIG